MHKPEIRSEFLLKVIDLSSEYLQNSFLQDSHSGTRIESPAYLFKGAKRIDEFQLETFVRPAVLLDLTRKKLGEPIDDEDLEAAEERAGLALREEEAVLLQTVPVDAEPVSAGTVKHPYLSKNGAEFLEFKHPSIVGTDALSLDPNGGSELKAHSVLMRANILVLEGLCNLDKIVQPRFQLLALPLKLRGSASPVRAVAIMEAPPVT